MQRNRMALLVASGVLATLIVGSGIGLKVGAADPSYAQVVLFAEIFDLVMDNYVDPVEGEELLEGAYEGLMAGLNVQGAYLTAEEVAAWKAAREHPAEAGPGLAVLKGYGALQIVAVDPGSPAEEAGLIPGDQIRSIDGESLADLSLAQGIDRLRGAPGSSVRLTVLHPHQGFEREELTLDRVRRSAEAYELEQRDGIAVLRIRDLSRTSATELRTELEALQAAGTEKLLLDLRNLVDPDPRHAPGLVALFGAPPTLALRDREGELLESVGASKRARGRRWRGELGLLVNGATAGAPEAVALLLSSADRATVFGESTFGLGAETQLFELPDGSGLLLSSAEWQAEDGASWNGEGLDPDREIPQEGDSFEAGFADQLRRTLEAFAETPARKAA